MAAKKKNELLDEPVITPELCNAWCFILGPALGAFCQLEKGHEDLEHLVGINIFTEPKAHFTVTWALDD
jgi:hypothetical protein